MRIGPEYLSISHEVSEALYEGRAVVALESTIIAHGMPYPQNVETALRVEAAVRENGVVPATLGIVNGRMVAGLSLDEIVLIGQKASAVPKVSRRDIPFILAAGGHGATTVAATMILADLAGIRVFATGGIGGVHRGATNSMDISADLPELANTNVAVVSAGAKAILDLALTLEYLETMGVPVIGFGTDEFPAFYSRKSGLPVDYVFHEVLPLAKAIHTKWTLGLQGGVLVANPIPEVHEMAYKPINDAIERALADCAERGIKGKSTTPFLLARIKELTRGDSLGANIELVLNNARLAGKLSVALASLINK
jgi:pseudouridine-5'-phosphate glycosidase